MTIIATSIITARNLSKVVESKAIEESSTQVNTAVSQYNQPGPDSTAEVNQSIQSDTKIEQIQFPSIEETLFTILKKIVVKLKDGGIVKKQYSILDMITFALIIGIVIGVTSGVFILPLITVSGYFTVFVLVIIFVLLFYPFIHKQGDSEKKYFEITKFGIVIGVFGVFILPLITVSAYFTVFVLVIIFVLLFYPFIHKQGNSKKQYFEVTKARLLGVWLFPVCLAISMLLSILAFGQLLQAVLLFIPVHVIGLYMLYRRYGFPGKLVIFISSTTAVFLVAEFLIYGDNRWITQNRFFSVYLLVCAVCIYGLYRAYCLSDKLFSYTFLVIILFFIYYMTMYFTVYNGY